MGGGGPGCPGAVTPTAGEITGDSGPIRSERERTSQRQGQHGFYSTVLLKNSRKVYADALPAHVRPVAPQPCSAPRGDAAWWPCTERLAEGLATSTQSAPS